MPDSDRTTTSTAQSVADLCAGAAIDNGDGTATLSGCPFQQQLFNFDRFGNTTREQSMHDATGRFVATATAACDTWRLGTDAEGVTVTVNTSTGEVRAHGMFHPGQPTTSLPQQVSAPLLEE